MAIRSGTGGLKYPLPANTDNQASIAAASAGGSASSSAYGANRRYAGQKMAVQAQLANSAAERQFRAMSQLEGQQFRAQSQLEGQRFQGEQGELNRQAYDDRQQAQFANQAELQQNTQRFTADQNVLQQTAVSDRDLRQIQAQQVAKLPEIPENARPQTKQHLQRLQTALQELVGQNWNPNDPATRDTFNQTYRDYQSVVQSIPKPDPVEKYQQNTFVDPDTGARMQEGAGGQYVEVPNSARAEAAKAQQQQQVAQERAAAERQTELRKIAKEQEEAVVGTGSDKRTQTPQEAMEAARKIYDERAAAGYYGASAPQSDAPQTTAEAGQPSSQQPAPAIPGARPEPEVQSTVSDIRSETKDLPIGEGETPEMRSFLESNLDNIVRYSDVPLDQVPEEARPAVDFYGRYTRSALEGKPIQLRTPEEASMLPPGTPYLDDQGNERRTKKKGAA